MKKIILFFLFLVMVVAASSQKVYFVYLQAETDQPFFVKMNERLYSSTASGYLILPNLKDSTYNFSIGFLQDKLPEQNFSLVVNKKDHGYLVKHFAPKGWALYDLQSSSVQMPVVSVSDTVVKTEKQNSSAFTDILSKAADDPSLKEKKIQIEVEEKKLEVITREIVKKEEVKPVITEQQIPKKEEPKVQTNEKSISNNEDIKAISSELYKRTVITKKSESSNTEGFGFVFIDDYENEVKDTIRLLIPNSKPLLDEVKQEAKEEKKFLEIIPDTTTKSKQIIPVLTKDTSSIAKALQLVSAVKNNCTDVATETDFYILRKNMAAESTDEKMILEAMKVFKTKCFTSLQLKNLSALFLNDASKYNFFDTAYKYVSDAENFALFQSELKDQYYIDKFKAMLQ